MNEKVDILNIPVDNISFSDVGKFAENTLLSQKQIKIFTPNPEILLKTIKDKNFANVLKGGDLLMPDGIGLVLFSKIKERITGVDLMLKICELAEKNKKSVFLLGGRNISEKTAKKLKEKFPQIQIAGFSEDLNSCYNQIEKSKVNILFVALGAPKQEIWISENIEKFPSVNIAMGVGGAFDMISEKVKRAPKFFQKIHLEWLFRLVQEPKRLKRIFNAVIIFPITLFLNKINFKK
jgi:N-acetylglucosaminyldiphosphoundecaprenol N-acetyl-beta-D-mannosaminyltransferase